MIDSARLEVKMLVPVLTLLWIVCVISHKFLNLSDSIFKMWCWTESDGLQMCLEKCHISLMVGSVMKEEERGQGEGWVSGLWVPHLHFKFSNSILSSDFIRREYSTANKTGGNHQTFHVPIFSKTISFCGFSFDFLFVLNMELKDLTCFKNSIWNIHSFVLSSFLRRSEEA